jgi:hypothetical protein
VVFLAIVLLSGLTATVAVGCCRAVVGWKLVREMRAYAPAPDPSPAHQAAARGPGRWKKTPGLWTQSAAARASRAPNGSHVTAPQATQSVEEYQ